MENLNIQQLVSTLMVCPSNDVLREISFFVDETQNNELNTVISNFFDPLLTLENWAWQVLSRDCRPWNEDEQEYFDLFKSLASFNARLISSNNVYNTKESLLLPTHLDIIDGLFEQIERRTDEDDRLLLMIYAWFENLLLLIHKHEEFAFLPIISYISQQIISNVIMSDQFKTCLNQLEHENPLFTEKDVFYTKTSIFLLSEYLCSKPEHFSYNGQEILDHLAQDFANIIHIHSQTMSSWSSELLSCITNLIGLVGACLWWIGTNREILEMFVIPSKSIYDHIESLIKILSYQPFHEQMCHRTRNDESMLIDNILGLLNYLIYFPDIANFFRSEKKLTKKLLLLDRMCDEQVTLRLYGLQSEILSNEQIKKLNMNTNINDIFLNYLQKAWGNSSKRYKKITIEELLKGLLNLSKSDTMNNLIFSSHQLNFLIEISDDYPIIYDILWSLSFDTRAQEQLRSNEVFLNKLENSYTDKYVQHAIQGIQWNLNLHGIQSRTKSYDKKNQIMISCSDSDLSECKTIYDELTENDCEVCIDPLENHPNLVDKMSEKIEQSNIIIICMSRNYKQSNYCRAEIQHAHKKNLKVIPIIIEENYQTDGWLSHFIRGTSPIDFKQHEFPKAMETLLNELKTPSLNVIDALVVRQPPVNVTNLPLPKSRSSNINQWTSDDVHQWLIQNNLLHMAEILSDYNGSDLIRLSEYLLNHSLEENIECLQEDSMRKTEKKPSATEMARLHGLLKDLIQVPVRVTKWNPKICCDFLRFISGGAKR